MLCTIHSHTPRRFLITSSYKKTKREEKYLIYFSKAEEENRKQRAMISSRELNIFSSKRDSAQQ